MILTFKLFLSVKYSECTIKFEVNIVNVPSSLQDGRGGTINKHFIWTSLQGWIQRNSVTGHTPVVPPLCGC